MFHSFFVVSYNKDLPLACNVALVHVSEVMEHKCLILKHFRVRPSFYCLRKQTVSVTE